LAAGSGLGALYPGRSTSLVAAQLTNLIPIGILLFAKITLKIEIKYVRRLRALAERNKLTLNEQCRVILVTHVPTDIPKRRSRFLKILNPFEDPPRLTKIDLGSRVV
jgi:hypothetical protein